MITLNASIELISGEIESISNASSPSYPSTEDINDKLANSEAMSDMVNTKSNGGNPFILGSSKLGMSALTSSVDYYIGFQKSNEYGEFAKPYVFSIHVKDYEYIHSFTISFDTVNNEYPKSIIVGGKEYVLDDAIFTITGLESSSMVSVVISNWNTANSHLVITGIYKTISININKRNMLSFDSSIFDRADTNSASFGIISNRGNLEFKDFDGEIQDYAESGMLTSERDLIIKLHNTLIKDKSYTIGNFKTDEWQYDNDNRTVSVGFKDDLEEWQSINVEAIHFDVRHSEPQPFKWLYIHLYNITVENGYTNILDFGSLDIDTKRVLENTYIKYPILEACSLWSAWTKLCEVCQLHIYNNNEGVIVCRYYGGN